ncbi:hypothetical protein I8752_20350 [Nostocaceae cyanobacterium CENA369]|uniref:Uncharacterized protein n=1 Tax=Dendronalium phyllosphericum CENA369 TaxID=1725256 RepID=A0A8J7LFK6_9NOST|nr:hypothetical protein [Dendronalium phyllosphericum]MBH8575321.1 hypothetical protein [Dendronalium phyllosphericum CENA369]
MKNKALALRNGNGHMNTEASCLSNENFERWRSAIGISVQCPPTKAKCVNHRATELC